VKSPSEFDGKPIGTPMDARSPFHAGVTVGPDQLERLAERQRLLNKARKVALSDAAKARFAHQTPEESKVSYRAHRRRCERAMLWARHLKNKHSIAWIAERYGFDPDTVLKEIKWGQKRRDRNKKRNAARKRQKAATVTAAGSRTSASTVGARSTPRGSISWTGRSAPDAVTGG
jgi:hypothetical protein